MLNPRRLLLLTLCVAAASCGHSRPEPSKENAKPSQNASEEHSIREVDFKNFDYPYKKSEPNEMWEQLDSSTRIKLVDGRRDLENDDSLFFNSVAYGDLDHDGQEEAAVDLRYSTGGTQNWHYLYVFKQSDRGVELISRFVSGSRADGGLIKATIRSGELIIDLADPERRQGDCCSKGFERMIYRLDGRTFQDSGPRYKGSFRNHAETRDNEQGPGSVHAAFDSNIIYTDSTGQEHRLTSAGTDKSPNLSLDKTSIVFVRNMNEVWTMSIDGSNQRKIFFCGMPGEKWGCHSPQFSLDGRIVYVIREVLDEEEGGIWKIDLNSLKAFSLIEHSSQFHVIGSGPKWGFIIANQRLLVRDRLGGEYARYPFYLFTSDGVSVRKLGEDEEYLSDLEDKLQS
jgi:hypothetical protein